MSLDLVKTPAEMRARATAWRHEGKRIAFVPTMGYLHRGHVSLLEAARKQAEVLVLSIFVNPTQFGPKEDLSRYPRDLDGDLDKARAAGVDVAYVPDAPAMYPDGYQTFVEVTQLEQGMCGASRPGHFRGVATVVLKLFNAVQPHSAFFGMKDYQQLQVIKRLTRDLDLDIEIVGMPIIREPDGLALSSRNAYLSPDERLRALSLSRALGVAQENCQRLPWVTVENLVDSIHATIHMTEGVRIDYVEARDAETLEPVTGKITRPVVLAIAAFVGGTRLIDNLVLRP